MSEGSDRRKLKERTRNMLASSTREAFLMLRNNDVHGAFESLPIR